MVFTLDKVEMCLITCGQCGIHFAVPNRWDDERRGDQKTFYCPNGHRRVYQGKTEAEKLKEQLASTKRELVRKRESVDYLSDEVASQEARITSMKGARTKYRAKIAELKGEKT